MDLSDAPGEAEFRLRARAWLAERLPRLPWPEPPGLEAKAPFWRQWQAMLFYFCPLVEDLADFRLSLEPLGGEFALDDELAEARRWLRLANQSRGTAIAGGSTFIQRNIIAERILGLPRG